MSSESRARRVQHRVRCSDIATAARWRTRSGHRRPRRASAVALRGHVTATVHSGQFRSRAYVRALRDAGLRRVDGVRGPWRVHITADKRKLRGRQDSLAARWTSWRRCWWAVRSPPSPCTPWHADG